MEEGRVVFNKGQVFKCFKCGDHIANFATDIHSHDIVSESHFEWVNQTFNVDDRVMCKKCGSYLWDELIRGQCN